MLALPEMGLQGYADFAFGLGLQEMAEQKQYYFREAETIPGPATERIAEAARRHGMFVQFGLAETALHGNVIFNSVALVGPEDLVGVYREHRLRPLVEQFTQMLAAHPAFSAMFGAI